MNQHSCHAKNCTVAVPPKMFMCKRHWFILPKAYRTAIWDAYVPGQEVTKTPSKAYLTAADACIGYVANYEAKYEQLSDDK